MAETKKKILIIDDDKSYKMVLEKGLADGGFNVISALDGQEGLIATEKEKPDLILVDIMMPKMDGITMVKKLKEDGVNIPVIFLTNMKDIGHISEAVETAPETDYIVKSDFNIDRIVTRVKSRLNLK